MMFLPAFEQAAKEPLIRFRDKTGGNISACPVLIEESSQALGGFSVVKRTYSIACGKLVRILVTDGGHIGVLAEYVSADRPVALYTSFDLPKSEDLVCNVAGKSRLVFRGTGKGTKLFRLATQIDGIDAQDAAGLLLPDGFVNPKAVRTTFYSGLHGFGETHCSVYGMTVEQSDRIQWWHMEKKDGYEISDPDKHCRLQIFLEKQEIAFFAGEESCRFSF